MPQRAHPPASDGGTTAPTPPQVFPAMNAQKSMNIPSSIFNNKPLCPADAPLNKGHIKDYFNNYLK
jgi:hypothetical protein